MRRVVVAADAESTLALLSELRGAVRIHARSGPGVMRLEHGSVGPVGIDRTTFDIDLDADVDPVGKLVFGQVSGGAVGFRTDGAEHWHSNSGVYLAAQPGRWRTTMVRGGVHQQAVIDPVLTGQIAGTEPAPPTSHDFDADAAICGTPAGKVLKLGFRPSSCHQPFSVAM